MLSCKPPTATFAHTITGKNTKTARFWTHHAEFREKTFPQKWPTLGATHHNAIRFETATNSHTITRKMTKTARLGTRHAGFHDQTFPHRLPALGATQHNTIRNSTREIP